MVASELPSALIQVSRGAWAPLFLGRTESKDTS